MTVRMPLTRMQANGPHELRDPDTGSFVRIETLDTVFPLTPINGEVGRTLNRRVMTAEFHACLDNGQKDTMAKLVIRWTSRELPIPAGVSAPIVDGGVIQDPSLIVIPPADMVDSIVAMLTGGIYPLTPITTPF